MKKYIIKIQETLYKEVAIEGENKKEALNKIKQLYKNENIVLYPEQCVLKQVLKL